MKKVNFFIIGSNLTKLCTKHSAKHYISRTTALLTILFITCQFTWSQITFDLTESSSSTNKKNTSQNIDFTDLTDSTNSKKLSTGTEKNHASLNSEKLTEQTKWFENASDSLPDDIDFWSNYPNETLAAAIVHRMSDKELYSQILMFGWAGAEPENLLFQWVGNIGLGSVKIFGWNTENTNLVAKSITALQKSAASRKFKIPLFVATDQEGGWIRHVKGQCANTPGNMSIGASGYPLDAWYSAFYINREIKALGINMNFAPTVDLFSNHESTIIGTRSFGEEPQKAGILGIAWASGTMAAGVLPTAKHFPGHGDTKYDSHIFRPEIDIDMETFQNRELIPFKYLIDANIPAIMSGHLSFPKIDPSGCPASLSPFFLQQILRQELGYKGLIITDDMTMNGATTYAGSLSNAFKMAITAGNDIILSSKTAKLEDPLWTANLSAMKKDQNLRARIQDAAYRVILAKLKYFKGKNIAPLYPNPDTIKDFIPDKEGQKYFIQQACRSITLYKQNLIPLSKEKAGRVLLAGSFPSFFQEGKKRYPDAAEFRYNYELGPNETQWMKENIVKTAAGYDTIVICVANDRSSQIAQTLKDLNKNVIIMSIMTPTHAFKLSWAQDILIGYSYSNYTFEAMFAAMNGEISANGLLPFTE